MTPSQIETAVFKLEQIRIVVRAPTSTKLGDFDYDRKAANGSSVSEWIDTRLKPILNGHDVVVVNGTGHLPHGKTRLDNLRKSYDHNT
jgi:hypothetical protein